MTRRGAGCRRQQNKQMEPGRPLQIPTVAPSRDPILGPVGHELGFPNMPKLAPSSTTSLHFIKAKLQQPCAACPASQLCQGTTLLAPKSIITSLLPRPKLAKCYRDIHLSFYQSCNLPKSRVFHPDVMLCHPVVVHNSTVQYEDELSYPLSLPPQSLSSPSILLSSAPDSFPSTPPGSPSMRASVVSQREQDAMRPVLVAGFPMLQ